MGTDGVELLPLEGEPPTSSTGKVHTALAALMAVDTGGDEQLAGLLAGAKMLNLPVLIESSLPDDPLVLDDLLERGARVFLQLRSDTRQDRDVFSAEEIQELADELADASDDAFCNGVQTLASALVERLVGPTPA